MKRKLLMVGGGLGDIPIILSAKKMGLHVITLSTRTESIAHQYSDQYIDRDYTDKDAVYEAALGESVDYICPCANDFAAVVCAQVAQRLGIPGHDTPENALIIHKKDLFRQFTENKGILAPRAQSFSNPKEAATYLFKQECASIVKPCDSTSGKGVSVLDAKASRQETEFALNSAFACSRAQSVLVEEYLNGTNHGFSALIEDEKVVFFFVDEEHYYLNKFMVSGASTSIKVGSDISSVLCNEIEKIASLLNLADGLFHVQFILTGGTPRIIEICRRTPGDLYVKLVEYATGVDYSSSIVNAFIGKSPILEGVPEETKYITRHCVMTDTLGKIAGVRISPEIEENVFDAFFTYNPGELIEDILHYKAGIVFLKYSTMDEMRNKVEHLNELISIELE